MHDLNPKVKEEKAELQKLEKSISYMKNTLEFIKKNV
jgi:hypothetical protein